MLHIPPLLPLPQHPAHTLACVVAPQWRGAVCFGWAGTVAGVRGVEAEAVASATGRGQRTCGRPRHPAWRNRQRGAPPTALEAWGHTQLHSSPEGAAEQAVMMWALWEDEWLGPEGCWAPTGPKGDGQAGSGAGRGLRWCGHRRGGCSSRTGLRCVGSRRQAAPAGSCLRSPETAWRQHWTGVAWLTQRARNIECTPDWRLQADALC